MKICYLSDASSVHTKKWCDFFLKKGYDIEVISLNEGKIDGVKVHSLDFQSDKIKSCNIFYKMKYCFKINEVKKIVNKMKPDIVHAHYASSYGLIGSMLNFHPYVLSVWGSDVYDFPNQSLLFKKIIKYNLSKADLIMSTSKVMAMETNKYTNKKIEITPFGVDINLFKPFEDKFNNREHITVGTIKTLEAKYGIEYLVRAFAEVCKRVTSKKMFLEIGGRGSQLEYLKNLSNSLGIKDNVKFLGFLNTNDVIESFNRFDIAVFPSTLDSESFGVAAVEAQACGTPVIVSNVGGLPEATKPGHSSILVNKKDEKELADALEKLVLDQELRIHMGKNGRKFIEDTYNIIDNFNKVDEIYCDIKNKY